MDKEMEDRIRLLEFDSLSAVKWAEAGKIEDWVHNYLSTEGGKSNPEFSKSLKRKKRWWNGPIKMKLSELSPAVGIAPDMEYVVNNDVWQPKISKLAESFSKPSSLPPLIIEYRSGELSIRDGNTRFGAMNYLSWIKCWVVIWYDTEKDFRFHSSIISMP